NPGNRLHSDRYGVAGSVVCNPTTPPTTSPTEAPGSARKCLRASRARRSSLLNRRITRDRTGSRRQTRDRRRPRRRLVGRLPSRIIRLLILCHVLLHGLADLREPFGGGALAFLVELLDRPTLRRLGGQFGSADRGAVPGLDLLAHRLERRHPA